MPDHVRDGSEHELVDAEHDRGDSRGANRRLSEDTLQSKVCCIIKERSINIDHIRQNQKKK